jgi:hypothetical protein
MLENIFVIMLKNQIPKQIQEIRYAVDGTSANMKIISIWLDAQL